tara:strand:- start:1608 stop:2351 length:744 start_codon:yes stop_codon:yes gene_type:complete
MENPFETLLNRPDGRTAEQLRPISIEAGIAPNATGSALIRFGNTQVICGACIEKKVPGWMQRQGVQGGWITAEYSMLPYSTHDRKDRDSSRGKVDGRSIEIQRLIGRALRAVVDLKKMPGYTLWIDCDVLQADGGTRTAAISGAYVAAQLAIGRLVKDGLLKESPFKDSVAAVSVGVYAGHPVLDLCYQEDKEASVDANIVMTGSGQFVELQSAGEEATFSQEQMDAMMSLAKNGITEITEIQKRAL